MGWGSVVCHEVRLAGMGRCGLVGQGAVWYDGVRQVRWGEIKSGGASYGLVWSGRLGKVRFGLVLCGLLGQAWLVRCDMV